MSDNIVREAKRIAFPSVIAAARYLCEGTEGSLTSEYIRGVVETICDTFEIPNGSGGYIELEDIDACRAEVFYLVTGEAKSPWGARPISTTKVVIERSINMRRNSIFTAEVPKSFLSDPSWFDYDGDHNQYEATDAMYQWVVENGDESAVYLEDLGDWREETTYELVFVDTTGQQLTDS